MASGLRSTEELDEILDTAGVSLEEARSEFDERQFENAFVAGSMTFVEPAQVQVSADGTHWYDFGCDPLDPELVGCAGVHPVLEAPEDDPAAAGGDPFDLEDVGLSHARYVRLIDRTQEYYGEDLWCMGAAGGFDLDAVTALEAT